MEERKKAVIIGGGITGLTAAYYLQKEAKEKKLALDVKLIEATHRLGGKIQTVIKDGFIIERGPDSFLARKKSATLLAKEVGMEADLVSNTAGRSFVLVKGRLHPIPGGSIMGIPAKAGPFITTGLFSIKGKLRAAADLILPRSKPSKDQSLGMFFRRRLGSEVVDNLIEPLLSGIYAGDIDKLSLMSTFPQFYQIEQQYRSLIAGMKRSAHQSQTSGGKKKDKGTFLTFKTGLESFVNAIESKLEPNSVLKGYRVDRINGENSRYAIEINGGEIIFADSIIMAVPHYAISSLFPEERYFDIFKEVPATSVATVALAFPQEAIEEDIDGTGFVVSRNSDYTITACTWTNKKWPHAAPKGKILLRCYVGRAGDEAIVDLSDDEIIKIVLDDLNKTMNITMAPELAVISRWKDSMPQYTVGHKGRIDKITNQLNTKMPGIFLAGSSYEGLGMPDCIEQGERAVNKVLTYLNI